MAGLSMTVLIPSHQRREMLRRLLNAVEEELAGSAALQTDLDVVVVLDGSTDGSYELLRGLDMPVPLRAVWQPHRGLAAARNLGLQCATGELVLFLDDDLLPLANLIARHRDAHRAWTPEVVIGPVIGVADGLPEEVHREYVFVHNEREGRIERFDQVQFVNASGPVSVFREVGGFDEGFRGWGFEDFELGARLLERGVTIRVDADAMALHKPAGIDFQLLRSRHRELGQNAVRLAIAHPWTVERLFVAHRSNRLLGALHIRSPRSLSAASSAVALAAKLTGPLVRYQGVEKLRDLALACAYAAGVAEQDAQDSFLPLMLGFSGPASLRTRAMTGRRG